MPLEPRPAPCQRGLGRDGGTLDGREQRLDDAWIELTPAGLLLTNVGGLLTTKAISVRFTATSGASTIDDAYLDPFKDT